MSFEELHELAAAYAIGALDPVENSQFEGHLDACDRCRREVAEYSGVVETLAQADAVVPPAELRSRVLDEVARTPQVSGVRSGEPVIDLADARNQRAGQGHDRRFRPRLLAAAAAILFVVGGTVALRALTDRNDAFDTVAAAPDAETLELEGDIGAVTVVYSPDQDQVGVLSADLPDPGAGRTYELWLVVEDGVAPAGLFVPTDGEVRQVLPVDDVETLGFGISIEPEGGSEQPTDILFLGTFET